MESLLPQCQFYLDTLKKVLLSDSQNKNTLWSYQKAKVQGVPPPVPSAKKTNSNNKTNY